MKNFIFLFISISLWTCSSPVKIDPEAEKTALLTAAKAYQDACTIMDVDRIVPFYTSDAKLISPGVEIVTGLDGIRNFMVGMTQLKNFQPRFETPEVNISSAGDMGYSLASIVISYEDTEGKTVSETDRDFHVWKKVGSEWKLAIDIWNSAPAPVTAESGPK